MSLTPEQTAAVSDWVTAGDNLSVIQKKLRDQFNVSMTYMDVRFLVDDLNLQLKDPPKKVDTSDVSKTPAKDSPVPPATAGDDLPPENDVDAAPAAGGVAGGIGAQFDHHPVCRFDHQPIGRVRFHPDPRSFV